MPSNRKDEQMKMTKEELAAKLEAHAKWLKTRYTDHVEGERANLTCADLTDANLTDADLTCANLTDANLTCADLTDANLTCADLTDANLTCANLTCADLTDADLTCANLTDANLTCADLTRADLTDANIEHVWSASTLVLDAISATLSARMALKKTRVEWEHNR